MKLEFSITRTDLTFGADPIPTTAADLLGSNVFHAPQYGVDSEPMESIAVAFSAPVGAGSATLDTYLWDAHSSSWYQFASGEIIAPGEIRFIPLPNIIDRKDSRASSKISVAVVVTPGAVPAGNYVLTLSSATSSPTSAGIDPPLEIEGATAEGDVPATNPLDLAAVVQDADPGPFVDGELRRLRLDEQARLITTQSIVEPANPGPLPAGDWRYLRLDDEGRLIVTDPTAGGGEVEGVVDDDDPIVATKPVVTGGVYLADPTADTLDDGDAGWVLLNELRELMTEPQGMVENADPGPLVDGVRRHLRFDDEGRLFVTDPSASPMIQGIDADHDAATANPVGVGGIYLADPTLNPLDDGDIGRVLLNEERMLVVEVDSGTINVQDLAYDPVTDANKVVPVVQTFDNHEPFDQSQAVATAAVITHYIDARTFPFWSMIWSTLTGGGVTIEIEISASNETTEPDLTLRSYEDITTDLYGGPIVLTAASAIALGVDTPLIYDSYRIQYTPSALATWTAEGKKGSF